MSSFRPSQSAAKANPNAISIRIKSRDTKGTANQRAHDLRIGRQPNYVDAKRSHLNRQLISALSAANIRKVCEDRREEANVPRQRAVAKNAAIATVGIITFGVEAQKVVSLLGTEQQDQLFKEVADAVAKRLATSITGLSIHLDETAIHAHFQMPAVSTYGTPVSKIAVKKTLNEIQSIAAAIAGRYDSRIERGTPRLQREKAGADRSQTINRQVRQLHDDLPAEIAEMQALAEAERARYDKNKLLADKAEAKANAEGARAEKAKRNLLTYERRAADALAKLEGIEEKLLNLQEIEASISAAKNRLAPLREAMDALDLHEAEQTNAAKAAAQHNAEAEAASRMFGGDAAITTLAVLASGDEVVSEDHGRELGGWQLGEIFEAHEVDLTDVSPSDFKAVSERLERAPTYSVPAVLDVLREEEFGGSEYDAVFMAVSKIGAALKATGKWTRDLFDKARGSARELIEMSFNRLTSALSRTQPPLLIDATPPVEAKTFTELPEATQEAIRKAAKSNKSEDPTSGP